MIDSLAIAAMIVFAPSRPNLERNVQIAAPKVATPVLLASAEAIRPEFATTCHLQTSSSCWSD